MNELGLIEQSLRLDTTAFLRVIELERLDIALLVVFLAGLSNALGQSIVLFANEVKPKRFVASLLLAALIYVFGFLFFTFSIWVVEFFLFRRNAPFITMVKVVGLAYAPYLFSFFVLTPYFGSFLAVALSLWSLAAILLALQSTLALSIWQALLCSALGWVLVQLVNRSIGKPLQSLVKAGRRLVAGTGLEPATQQLRQEPPKP